MNYTEHCFTTAEVGRTIEVAESTIRHWRDKIAGPLFGKKKAGRVLFSARDCVLLKIMSDLVESGISPASAHLTAFRLTGELSPRPIPEGQFYMAGRTTSQYAHWLDLDEPTQTVAAVPIGAIYADVLAKAEARYATAQH